MTYRKTGVLVMAFGGPGSLAEIEPFMMKLTGRVPSQELLERVTRRYEMIGGASPLPEITRQQTEALESELGSDEFTCYVGMRYSSPGIGEAVEAMTVHGIEKAVALSMSPHSSRVSTAAYVEEVRRATAKTKDAPEFLFVDTWHKESLFLEAVADKVRAGLAAFGPDAGETEIIFSAHSLPRAYVDEGDPYIEQLGETVAGVVERLGQVSWRIAYQSRGGGPGEWLGPEVGDVLAELATGGKRRVLVVPIGFTADHIETLYDIDIAMRDKAESLGLMFERTESLNVSPKFIEALAGVVRERLRVQ